MSQVEFVASYAHVLDPASKDPGNPNTVTVNYGVEKVSPVAIAFGLIRLGASVNEVIGAANAATEYIQRILDNPSTKSFWRIPISEKEYHKRIGRLLGTLTFLLEYDFFVIFNIYIHSFFS